jgi:SAM-dependent methyltransferase
MKRKIVNFTWDDEDAQAAFAEWCPFPNVSATSDDVDRIEAIAGLTPPIRILDVGCGNGRHAIEMARRGYRVVGIDVAKRFLAEAQEKLSSSGVEAEFRFQRASELREAAEFDFALAYWHTIGFMSHDEIERHFAAICTALRPSAWFLYVFQGPRLIPGREGQTSRNWKEQNGRFILTDKSVTDGFRDEDCIVIDTNTGEVTEYREHQRAVGFQDVMKYLTGAGFGCIEAYKDFEKNPATPEEFSIFLCRKE